MNQSRRVAGVAAFSNAVLALATFVVAFVWIGIEALADRSKFIQLALENPTPLIVQDGLKFLSATVSIVLIIALRGMLTKTNVLNIGTGFGIASAVLLDLNGALSLYAVTQLTAAGAGAQGEQINLLIAILGMLSIFLSGIWYLCIHWQALLTKQLPKGLSILGIVIGVLSLLPPFAILVLILSIVWSVWLGATLLREAPLPNFEAAPRI